MIQSNKEAVRIIIEFMQGDYSQHEFIEACQHLGISEDEAEELLDLV